MDSSSESDGSFLRRVTFLSTNPIRPCARNPHKIRSADSLTKRKFYETEPHTVEEASLIERVGPAWDATCLTLLEVQGETDTMHACRRHKRIRKTNIYFKARLSSTQGERYLPALEKAGFIVEDAGSGRLRRKGFVS